MMEQSLFLKWLDRYFKGIVVKTVETLNGKNGGALTYLFKGMLRKECCPEKSGHITKETGLKS